ncbi:short chain dehydrogenase [Paenibacillus sp. P26]|nr:short chain dehydrogenase [Paenibacillus sp. P26]
MTITKKAVVIGATGTIGRAVADALEARNYEVVRASRNGDVQVDLEAPASIDALFARVDAIDAVVVTAGSGRLTPLEQVSEEEFVYGMKSKVLGQVHLLRRAADHLRDGGSITITGGNMFEHLIPGSAVSAFVNNGLEGFVRAAAVEMSRGIRVNIVSPGWVKETLESLGTELITSLGLGNVTGTATSDVAQAYVQAIEGTMTGQTIVP